MHKNIVIVSAPSGQCVIAPGHNGIISPHIFNLNVYI